MRRRTATRDSPQVYRPIHLRLCSARFAKIEPSGQFRTATSLSLREVPSWFKTDLIPPATDKDFRPGTPMVLLSGDSTQLNLYIAPFENTPDLLVAVLSSMRMDEALCSPALILEEVQGSSAIRSFRRVRWCDRDGSGLELVFHVDAGRGKVLGRRSLGDNWNDMQVKPVSHLPPVDINRVLASGYTESLIARQ